jgi:hypothetical protein
MALIALSGSSKGQYAIVDDDLYEKLNKLPWYLEFNGEHYRVITAGGGKLHHFVIGPPSKGLVTAHVNGDGLDNRRKNLEHVTQSVNLGRDFARTSKGYYFDKSRNLWNVQIAVEGRRVCGGRFATEVEAKQRADELRADAGRL